jgi:hypothetical protein
MGLSIKSSGGAGSSKMLTNTQRRILPTTLLIPSRVLMKGLYIRT